jgi:hypothetical protein
MKGRSWKTNCPPVLAAGHKFDQDNRVRSLHEPNKSAHVRKGQGRTQVFQITLCVFEMWEKLIIK